MWGNPEPDPLDLDVRRGWTSMTIACVMILLVALCCLCSMFALPLHEPPDHPWPPGTPTVTSTEGVPV